MIFSDFALALAAGLGLGAFFFGGLWWTTRRALASSRPAAWFVGSFVVRTGVTLGGFYLVGDGRWERLATCLLGFVVARMAATRLTKNCMNGGK
jgi:F1F0 ATPase subunit 2